MVKKPRVHHRRTTSLEKTQTKIPSVLWACMHQYCIVHEGMLTMTSLLLSTLSRKEQTNNQPRRHLHVNACYMTQNSEILNVFSSANTDKRADCLPAQPRRER